MVNRIEKIKIENYRGIKNGSIEDLGDINVFLGKNGSGKSTILESIFLASHNFQNLPDPKIYGGTDQDPGSGTKMHFLMKKRKLPAFPVAVIKQSQNKNYQFFGLGHKNWWFGNDKKEKIAFIFKFIWHCMQVKSI